MVSGICSPDKIWVNSGAQSGDALILKKPLGTSILTTALKRGLLPDDIKDQVIKSMSELNKKAAETISAYSVHACTDVTGFGFIGHLSELTTASGVDVEVLTDEVPYFEKTAELAAAGVVPGGSANNLLHFSKHVIWEKPFPKHQN